MDESKYLDELKDFISNWSSKTVDGLPIDTLLLIDGIPLSWFYRPILYSSLLPQPFATIEDIKNARKISFWKSALFSYSYRKYILFSTLIKRITYSKKESKNAANQRILFLTFSNHLGKETFRISNIEKIISQHSAAKPLVLVAEPLSQRSFKKIKREDCTPYNYYTKEILEKAKYFSAKLSKQWKSVSSLQKNVMFTYHSKNFYPSLRSNLNFLYSPEFIKLVLTHYYAFQRALEEEKVRAIVLTSQNNIVEKCLIAASVTKKIPVIIVQHGIGLGFLPTLDTPPNVYFAVFGEKYRRQLVRRGIQKENIIVTGPIIFDGIEKCISPRLKNENIFLLATSPIIEDRFMEKEAYFSRILKILSDFKKTKASIILKLHPREKNHRKYERIIQESGVPAKITSVVTRDEHYAMLEHSDLVITFGSTVALEAMIIGRPTLTIDLFDGKNPLNDVIRSAEASTGVHYTKDIGEAAAALLTTRVGSTESTRKAQKFVEDLCYKIDGKASERVVQAVNHLMQRQLESQ